MSKKLHFIGTYSAKQMSGKISKKKEYFFVFRTEKEGQTIYVLEELNEAFIPNGNVNTADPSILRDYFVHEPNILAMPLTKPEVSLENLKISRKEQQAEHLPTTPVELEEAKKARAKVAEQVLRADFEQAFDRLDRPNERNRALRAIKKIAAQEEGIVPEHKHMFRDFSVGLRKKSLPEIALLFASKNVRLDPSDDHAHFNLARLYLMLERFDDAIDAINVAIDTQGASDGDLYIYNRLLDYAEREKRKRLPPTPAHS